MDGRILEELCALAEHQAAVIHRLAEALARAEALGREERRLTEEAAEAYRRCLGEGTNGSA